MLMTSNEPQTEWLGEQRWGVFLPFSAALCVLPGIIITSHTRGWDHKPKLHPFGLKVWTHSSVSGRQGDYATRSTWGWVLACEGGSSLGAVVWTCWNPPEVGQPARLWGQHRAGSSRPSPPSHPAGIPASEEKNLCDHIRKIMFHFSPVFKGIQTKTKILWLSPSAMRISASDKCQESLWLL